MDINAKLNRQQNKLTDIVETILVLRYKIFQFEFKLESTSQNDISSFKQDIRKCRDEMNNLIERRCSKLKKNMLQLPYSIKETFKGSIKETIWRNLEIKINETTNQTFQKIKINSALKNKVSTENIENIIEKSFQQHWAHKRKELAK